jgi:hypothetical protein
MDDYRHAALEQLYGIQINDPRNLCKIDTTEHLRSVVVREEYIMELLRTIAEMRIELKEMRDLFFPELKNEPQTTKKTPTEKE